MQNKIVTIYFLFSSSLCLDIHFSFRQRNKILQDCLYRVQLKNLPSGELEIVFGFSNLTEGGALERNVDHIVSDTYT